MNHNTAFTIGVLVGGIGMYVLDPSVGRRRRALARDQVTHARHKVNDRVGGVARDLSNRVSGRMVQLRTRLARTAPMDIPASHQDEVSHPAPW